MDSRLSPGSRLAGYRIEALIGTGGMGSVFRARDERLGRQVALKVLSEEIAQDPEFRTRFVRESKAAAAVDHPNILPIFEAGESDGRLFIAMRYVRGGDVQSLLNQEGTLSPSRTLSIVTSIAAALDAANSSGIVHRDVKPGNMLLDSRATTDSHVYLTDFGITTLLAEPDLTPDGSVVGTLQYMAPEALQGRPVDGRADQYGLACSAFVMLSGTPPFEYRNAASTVLSIINEPPPSLTSRRPELPPAVDEVFARALAKSPGSRFATCGHFAEALAAALGSPLDRPRAASAPVEALDIPLKRTFRYVHEPSRADDDALASLGNDGLIAELESRIRHSRGGTFLITGFRGVGKTTLVMRALDELVVRSAPGDLVLPVSLSVARSTTTERLLFAIVRRVFETLSDSGALEKLPPQTRHALLVAYMRTSLSFKQTQGETRQQSAGLDVSVGPGKLVKAVADIAAPKVSMSASRSQSLATEAAFLAYSETDVEYDLMRIVSLVDRRPAGSVSRWRHWRRRLIGRGSSAQLPRLHLVIVLDEVDKLTVDEAGMATVEELLAGIKNILTMPGAHFLVVAGPDLQDRAVRDAARGNGVYESVFGWRMYVPCVWDAAERLIADITRQDAGLAPDRRDALVHYLRFKARGVPRRLLQEVNDFVAWDDDHPRLRVSGKDMERVEFYARIERVLRGYMEGNGHGRLFPVAIDEDRWRLGGYYVVDWVLQSEGEPFSTADLLREGEEANFDPLLRISRRSIDGLLDHLAHNDILEVVRDTSASNTLIGDVAESAEKVFRLSDEMQHLLYGFAARRESERAGLEVSLARPVTDPRHLATDLSWMDTAVAPAAGPGPAAGSPPLPVPDVDVDVSVSRSGSVGALVRRRPKVIGERYELGELIGQGGLSSVYKGRDILTGRQVTVKLLRSGLAVDEVALARFRREAEITKRLDHPQVARTLDVLEEPGTTAIITELLHGPTLAELVRDDGPMSPGEVVAIGQILADALRYLAGERIVRLDLKPESIVMAAERGPVITDLGIAFRMDSLSTGITAEGLFVGTPAFMAPEVIEGRDADSRADLYALGLVLYFCLTGVIPWGEGDVPAILYRILTERLDLSRLPISAPFRAALERTVAKNRNDRYSDAEAFGEALRDTPEWRSVSHGPDDTRVDDRMPRPPSGGPTPLLGSGERACRPRPAGRPGHGISQPDLSSVAVMDWVQDMTARWRAGTVLGIAGAALMVAGCSAGTPAAPTGTVQERLLAYPGPMPANGKPSADPMAGTAAFTDKSGRTVTVTVGASGGTRLR